MSDSDEDWFEKALREADEEANGSGGSDDHSTDAFDSDAEPSDDPFGGESFEEAFEDDGGEADQADPFDGEADQSADDPFGGEADQSADDPFGGVQSPGNVEEDPFGASTESSGDEDPFGGVRNEQETEDPFGEGFEAAMGGVGGGEEFDDAEFDSDIDRVKVGIEGLDEMILGGVPVRSLITVIGSAGTGKTTFGLQFLNEELKQGGQCVYITLEETQESIISSAEEKGWPFTRYVENGSLVVVSMDPIEMANSLDSIRGDLTRLINEFGADRLVLDSVSLLEMMYDDPATRRSEVFDFARSLKRAGVTTMLTSEANADNPFQSRHGLVEYLVDAVFVLRYVRPSDFQETRLAVEIQKIRDANHSRETKPYDITSAGIDVYRQANIF